MKFLTLFAICFFAIANIVGAQSVDLPELENTSIHPMQPPVPDGVLSPLLAETADRFPVPLTANKIATAETVRTIKKKPIEKGFNGDALKALSGAPNGTEAMVVPPLVHRKTGFIDLNSYWDNREFTVFTMNAGAKLPHQFEYFQFFNAFSPPGSNSTDWNAFYTEQNLRRPIWSDSPVLKHLDWTLQYADGTFAGSVLRAGIRWRIHDTPGPVGRFVNDVLKLRVGVTVHALESDGTGWQMEYAFRRDFFGKRFYIGGFADHNIDDGGRSSWVTEAQFGVRVYDQWHAVAEYRYSSFERAAFKSGWGFGVEYVIRFN